MMDLYHKRGRQPKWKPISLDLKTMNANGALNAALAEKGMHRSNNAVMNKVKELLFKEAPDDEPDRVRLPSFWPALCRGPCGMSLALQG